MRIENEADGIFFSANAERVHFQRRFVFGDRFTHLEHVRTKNKVGVRVQMISIVFHKGGTPRQIGSNRLHRPNQGTGFPITFSAKAVAIRHQALHCQPG